MQLRNSLEEQSMDLVDTSAFDDKKRSLERLLAEGLDQAKTTNVGHWKLESDDATRCAAQANQVLELQCDFFCLFNKVPLIHKRKSREHLMTCFRQSEGTRLPLAMQE